MKTHYLFRHHALWLVLAGLLCGSLDASAMQIFVKMLTEEGDVVVDPFAGSNTTGVVAECLRRRWIAIERVSEYLEASKARFETGGAEALRGEATQATLFS